MEDKLKELEKRIGYKFQDFSLLKHALMHSSYTNEKHLPKYQCNEKDWNFWEMQFWSWYPVSFIFGKSKGTGRKTDKNESKYGM